MKTVSIEKYNDWLWLTTDRDKWIRFGQDFCNHFKITDPDVFYQEDMKIAGKLIFERHVMSYAEMLDALFICDQTVGCDNCGRAWWGENCTEDITMFHVDGCPLKGRKDIHANSSY